jgi:ATP-binding cassette subfamily B protein
MASSTTKQSLKLYWRFTRPYKKFFWAGTLGAIAGVFVMDIVPQLVIARAFDRLQATSAAGAPLNLNDFVPYLVAYTGLALAAVAIWRTQVWCVWQYEIRGIRDMAIYIFDHLQHMGRRFHANNFGGALVSQTNKLLGAYEKTMDEFTWSITTGITTFVSALVVLAFTTPAYAAVYAAVSAVYFYILYRRIKKTMPYDRALARSESKRTAKLADMITNVSAVSSFAGEVYEKKLFEAQADDTARHYHKLFKKVLVNDALSHGMTASITAIAFIAGILAITVLHQPAGALFLAVSYTMQLTRRLWESNRVMRNLNRAFGDATDMTEILDMEAEIKDAPNAAELAHVQGNIQFHKVTFAYENKDDRALFKNLSLRIKPGEKVGLVGHSGGGKTTITTLLLRFIDIRSGQIAIDGQNIATATQASLRRAIAYVPQEPLLFHRSLAENISYGNPTATQADIETVAKLAHAHEFIQQLPDGYKTLVGERGVKLSGGQRQRVAIARAMLKNAPILVLDEATSALDSESEMLIQDALWKLMEGRTALVIAHRLSTIQKMDRILVMDKGKIVEEGSHKQLLKNNGIYAKLWGHQSGGFLED